MKLVIPTDDFVNMVRRTGHAKYFAVYKVENNNIELDEKFENNHDHSDEHHHDNEDGHGHSEQTDLFKQYDALVVNMLGSHFKADVIEAKINVFYTKKSDIKEAIMDFLENGEH